MGKGVTQPRRVRLDHVRIQAGPGPHALAQVPVGEDARHEAGEPVAVPGGADVQSEAQRDLA
jgi:hypothetical protein